MLEKLGKYSGAAAFRIGRSATATSKPIIAYQVTLRIESLAISTLTPSLIIRNRGTRSQHIYRLLFFHNHLFRLCAKSIQALQIPPARHIRTARIHGAASAGIKALGYRRP
jgi:hypothetical protein